MSHPNLRNNVIGVGVFLWITTAVFGCNSDNGGSPTSSTGGTSAHESSSSTVGGASSFTTTRGGQSTGPVGGTSGAPGTAENTGGTGTTDTTTTGNSGGTTNPTTARSCNAPVFTTSDTNGGTTMGDYYVHNNMWNDEYTLGKETLYACSYDNWYVVSNQKNDEGAVKTYPNVHKDYNDIKIDTFKALSSRFAASSPHVGIYNVAYDIWLNGVATDGCTEVMIWTENYHQVPAGDKVATDTVAGVSYAVWKTQNNGYIAFVPETPMTSGNLDIRALFDYLIGKGWLSKTATLGQICYGVEIVSTEGHDATFTFTDFSISES